MSRDGGQNASGLAGYGFEFVRSLNASSAGVAGNALSFF